MRPVVLSWARVALLALLVLAATGCQTPNPYQRGPAPTDASVEAPVGPFAFASVAVPDADTPGFGAATIYHPTSTSGVTFGGVAIAPGWTETQSAVSWFGPLLASHGFVVITIDTNDVFDNPAARSTQLLAALDHLTGASPVRHLVDPARLAVMGHSMGGGGSLDAAKARPSLRAVVSLTGFSPDPTWPEIQSPTLLIGAQDDTIAPVDTFSKTFYRTLPNGLPKAYVELAGANHFVTNARTPTVARYVTSWLKRFVDNDRRYERFLCPGPAIGGVISAYQSTCPYAT